MEDLIDSFFSVKYTPEVQQLLYRAAGIFAVYNYQEPFGEIVDLMAKEQNMDSYTISDGVRQIMELGIQHLLFANRITVLPETSFSEAIRILEGIYMLTRVTDAQKFLPVLSGWLSNEEKLAKILGLVFDEDYAPYFCQLNWVYEGTIARFKIYFDQVQAENDSVEISLLSRIRENLFVFEQVFGKVPIVESLAEINFFKGLEFNLYVTNFKDQLFDAVEMDDTVFALLFLAFNSNDAINNPVEPILNEARSVYTEPHKFATFNSKLTVAMGQFLPALQAHRQKA